MAHVSETPATQWLKSHQVPYSEYTYDYIEHGGTAELSRALGVDEYHVDQIYINGSQRGFLVGIDPQILKGLKRATMPLPAEDLRH